MKTMLFIFSLCLVNITAFSQPKPEVNFKSAPGKGLITGQVSDGTDNKAMEYVNISLHNIADSSLITGSVSGPDGSFKIKDVPFGDFNLSIQFMGYKSLQKPVTVDANNKTVNLGAIVLNPVSQGLNEVNVEAERNYVQYKIDKKVIDVSKNPNSAGGTATDALREVPGVTVDAEGNVSIRGNSNITVLVDGRPTAMSAADILRQTPAGSIQNIEVITNPSAKYDPNGSSGIINIIMKKQLLNGTNGIINSSIGTGEKYSTDFLMNYRINQWNFFAGGGYNYRQNSQYSKIERKDFMGDLYDTTKFINSEFKRAYIPHGYNIKAGADYFANESTTISITQEAGNFNFDRKGNFYHQLWYEPGPSNIYYVVDDKFFLNGNFLNSSLNLQKKFSEKGHELNANVFYSWFDATRLNEQSNQTTDALWNASDLTPLKYKTENIINRNNITAKADYTKPLSDTSKFETGFQSDLSNAEMTYHKYDFVYNPESWNENSAWNSSYSIFQQIHAAYGTYSNVIKGIEFQAGLRGEYMKRNLETNLQEKNALVETFKIYPTLHLSYKLPSKQSIQASYSRRTQRPEEWMLNPYPNFSDGQFTSLGNAKLKSSNMDAVELNYMKVLEKGTVSATGFYRHNTDIISQMFNWENGVFITKWDNVGTNNTYGLESMCNLKLLKWLRINAGGSLFQDDLFINTSDTTSVINKNLNYNVRVSPGIELKTGTIIQVTGIYNGPNYFGQGWSEPNFMMDIAVRQSFFKKKLTVSLRASNITGSKFNIKINDSRFAIKQVVVPEPCTVMLNVSYNINNYTRSNRNNNSMQFEGGL